MGILFTLAIVAAVIATYRKRWRRTRLRRNAQNLPGTTPERAIPIDSFTDIDDTLRDRWCPRCGGYLERAGEGTRTAVGRTLRVARLRCQECDEVAEVFFDATTLLH